MNKKSKLQMIPTDKLHPHPDNPRNVIGDVSELAESIKANGILQNLTVVPNNDDGTPTFCPYRLGIMGADDCRKDGNCVKCWNQPVEESEK